MPSGWRRLIPPADVFRGEGNYPIDAYSEFMPPPRPGWKAYGGHVIDPEILTDDDPFGWHISEYQEAIELQPGLVQVGRQVIGKLLRLLDGDAHTAVIRDDLENNPFWPA